MKEEQIPQLCRHPGDVEGEDKDAGKQEKSANLTTPTVDLKYMDHNSDPDLIVDSQLLLVHT